MAEIDANDRVSVKVTPDLRKFLPEMRKELKRIQQQVEVAIRVLPDMGGFREKVAAATRAMPPAKVPVEPDTDGFDPKTRRATERMRPVQLPVQPDLDQFRRRAAGDVQKALAGLEATLPLSADGDRVRRQAAVLAADVQRRLEAMRVSMPVLSLISSACSLLSAPSTLSLFCSRNSLPLLTASPIDSSMPIRSPSLDSGEWMPRWSTFCPAPADEGTLQPKWHPRGKRWHPREQN